MMLPPLPAPLDAKNSFAWQIPWNSSAKGSIVDMSPTIAVPAGKNGRVMVRDGHFVESKTGKRLRFVATNVGAEAAFPTRKEADLRATMLARQGITLVRLHHLNNGWGTETGGSIWRKGRNWVEIDPAQVDKLDYFIAAMIRKGIYVNMNLQVSREYVEEHGFPPSVRQLKQFAKKIDKVNRRMIELQKQFAKDLLDRTNPYLKTRYRDEPGLAFLEINNENSLVGWPGEAPGAGLDGFPEPFRSEIRDRWVAWLKAKYVDDAGLQRAWPKSEAFTGPSLTTGRNQWTYENQGGGTVNFSQDGSPSAGSPNFKAEVVSADGVDWHVQAHVGGLDLKSGQDYVVSFRARADRAMAIGVDARLDQPDWRFLGLGSSVSLTPEWKEYRLGFRAIDTVPNHGRIGFRLGERPGTVEIQNLVVRPGRTAAGVPAGESLAKGNLSFPGQDGSPGARDWTRFLTETETAYSEEMRRYLRNNLGFRAPMIDSQIAWGGLTAIARERSMEYADNHAYWNHPIFAGGDWNPNDYKIARGALVNEWNGRYGSLGELARTRIVGRPYSISEYDHPAPSDFVSEMMPLVFSFAAWQDWDAVYTFAWSHSREGQANDGIMSYFDVDRNPAVAAFYPAAAVMFAEGGFPTAKVWQTVTVEAERPYEPNPSFGAAWADTAFEPSRFKVGVAVGKPPVSPRILQPSPYRAEEGDGGKIVTGVGPMSSLIAGFVNERSVAAGPLTIRFGRFGGFATAALVSRDGKPIATSKRRLLTLVGRVENPGWKWNETRTSVGNDWGRGPTVCERIPGAISVRAMRRPLVYALDGAGRRVSKLPVAFVAGRASFKTADTLWYEIVDGGGK